MNLLSRKASSIFMLVARNKERLKRYSLLIMSIFLGYTLSTIKFMVQGFVPIPSITKLKLYGGNGLLSFIREYWFVFDLWTNVSTSLCLIFGIVALRVISRFLKVPPLKYAVVMACFFYLDILFIELIVYLQTVSVIDSMTYEEVVSFISYSRNFDLNTFLSMLSEIIMGVLPAFIVWKVLDKIEDIRKGRNTEKQDIIPGGL